MINKKQSLMFMAILSLVVFLSAILQSGEDYFAGTWRIKVVGTPLGDFTRNYLFEKRDGKLIGVVQDTTGAELSKMTNLEVKDKTLTSDYKHETYDVKLSLVEVDEDHVKGKILDAYEVTGVRLKNN